MAVKSNSPDRSDLESKSREDLQAIVKLTGAEVSARASKATLIETIIGATSSDVTESSPVPRSTRVVRSRRTVATPDDFESLVNEFSADLAASAPPEPARVTTPREGEANQSSDTLASPRHTPGTNNHASAPVPGAARASEGEERKNKDKIV